MLMAAFGGVRGNLPALDAVLAAIDHAGIHTVANAGDSVLGYPWPNEVLVRLQSRRMHSVQGEMDRLVVRARRKADSLRERIDPALMDAAAWTHRVTQSSNLEFLGTMPRRIVYSVEGLSVCLCHGTPCSQSERLSPGDDDIRFRRQREYANVHVVIMGGGSEPFSRIVDGTLFVNPGLAGRGEGNTPTACYAVISTETSPWSVEFHHVPYETDSLKEQLALRGLDRPWPLPDDVMRAD
ncbi:MAG: metallophosphoesterase family protein [Candidatus Hydrogenedentes bacterium]|nr:metallophosphoesterase family protein [Candidatus Hydrogenedentota bacterium]